MPRAGKLELFTIVGILLLLTSFIGLGIACQWYLELRLMLWSKQHLQSVKSVQVGKWISWNLCEVVLIQSPTIIHRESIAVTNQNNIGSPPSLPPRTYRHKAVNRLLQAHATWLELWEWLITVPILADYNLISLKWGQQPTKVMSVSMTQHDHDIS